MRYTSFYIKNYKGIKDLTLDLDKKPTSDIYTLVGLNESGKTTILEAISTFFNEPSDVEIHKLIPKSKKFNFNDTIEIHATLELNEDDNKAIDKWSKESVFTSIDRINQYKISIVYTFKDSEYVPEESGRVYSFRLSGSKKGQRNSRNYGSTSKEFKDVNEFIYVGLLPPIIYYPNFLFDFPTRIYLEESNTEDKEQKIYRAVLNDILDTFNEGLNINDHIVNRLKNSTEAGKEALDATIDRMSAQITKIVFDAWGQIFTSNGKEIKLKPSINTVGNLAYLEFKLKEGLEQFQISERSLGFKWFFTFLLFTEFRKNRRHEKGEILFLLDEPASNLHSTAQKKLLTTFENLVTNCKLIYTTHSHHLINPKWLSGAYIVRNKAIDYNGFDSSPENTDVEATIYKQFVTTHPEQRTYFQPILDAIEYSPSSLEEVPNIVLTEGKNDYYTFRYMAEIILKEENYDIKFYPGNGADRNNQIIATYLAWGRDFSIFLDGDKAGDDAKNRYIKEFGVVVHDSISTLKDVDPTFNVATEQIFTPHELLEIQKTFAPAMTGYNKSAFNTALQNLFISEQEITLSAETRGKFKKILDFLK